MKKDTDWLHLNTHPLWPCDDWFASVGKFWVVIGMLLKKGLWWSTWNKRHTWNWISNYKLPCLYTNSPSAAWKHTKSMVANFLRVIQVNLLEQCRFVIHSIETIWSFLWILLDAESIVRAKFAVQVSNLARVMRVDYPLRFWCERIRARPIYRPPD